MYFINDNIVDIKHSGIKEGGVVRNTAWIEFLNRHREDTKFVDLSFSGRTTKYLNYFRYLFFAATVKNSQIFALYPKVGLPVLASGKKGALCKKLYLMSLAWMIRHGNEIIFDISDIKYEQAIDLELDNLDMEQTRLFEQDLFRIGQKYIFASHAMRAYAAEKHSIPWENTEVCVNGGYLADPEPLSDISLPKDRLRFVYAGTLNKGRMIEQMIDAFPECTDKAMILLGISGDWIPDYLKTRGRTNILYLGAFEEQIARRIVAGCHVGLIPYDDSRPYYNIAYPTKLSFYIAAGVPYLATPVAEILRVQEKHDMGYTAPIREWGALFTSITAEALSAKKQTVAQHRMDYTWNSIFQANKFI